MNRYRKMDADIKKDRLEVLKRFPEFGIRLILKYNMYFIGNRLAMVNNESDVSLIHSGITDIVKDKVSTDIIAEGIKIVLWNNPRLRGISVYM